MCRCRRPCLTRLLKPRPRRRRALSAVEKGVRDLKECREATECRAAKAGCAVAGTAAVEAAAIRAVKCAAIPRTAVSPARAPTIHATTNNRADLPIVGLCYLSTFTAPPR